MSPRTSTSIATKALQNARAVSGAELSGFLASYKAANTRARSVGQGNCFTPCKPAWQSEDGGRNHADNAPVLKHMSEKLYSPGGQADCQHVFAAVIRKRCHLQPPAARPYRAVVRPRVPRLAVQRHGVVSAGLKVEKPQNRFRGRGACQRECPCSHSPS